MHGGGGFRRKTKDREHTQIIIEAIHATLTVLTVCGVFATATKDGPDEIKPRFYHVELHKPEKSS